FTSSHTPQETPRTSLKFLSNHLRGKGRGHLNCLFSMQGGQESGFTHVEDSKWNSGCLRQQCRTLSSSYLRAQSYPLE
ncbi:hypothetical protein STEG23_034248, partial [Scotinomys teguina]